MKTDVKANQTPDDMLNGTAEAVLDAIRAEPVPPEMMELALKLQAKFSEQNSDDAASDGAVARL
ncbi:hypothetical protein G3572_09600 [Rhodobacter sp. ETT8]|uniref:DUF2497 domain-containing protein n=1 Tax=Pseudotabrizicola algicola TaxID=2709381 RepID=A0A6B3RTQ7_9RHOB|nr:hypothetical protein [Pseudotabrizicola algicola]